MAGDSDSDILLVGIDGGGTGTRALVADPAGTVLARGSAGPSGLGLGIGPAWQAIGEAVADAFGTLGLALDWARCVVGCGLAGVNQVEWRDAFRAAAPPVRALAIESDAFTTVLGAHGGQPGVIVALGTGSIAAALLEGLDAPPQSSRADSGVDIQANWRIAGGYGFPSGDEASGAWLGLRIIGHAQRVLDGRSAPDRLADALIAHTGARDRDSLVVWCTQATQTRYAQLAPIVIAHAAHPFAAQLLAEAGVDIARMIDALDSQGRLPVALCGGLADALTPFVPLSVRDRLVPPRGDSVQGALSVAWYTASRSEAVRFR
jgi:glucosamine kinase